MRCYRGGGVSRHHSVSGETTVVRYPLDKAECQMRPLYQPTKTLLPVSTSTSLESGSTTMTAAAGSARHHPFAARCSSLQHHPCSHARHLQYTDDCPYSTLLQHQQQWCKPPPSNDHEDDGDEDVIIAGADDDDDGGRGGTLGGRGSRHHRLSSPSVVVVVGGSRTTRSPPISGGGGGGGGEEAQRSSSASFKRRRQQQRPQQCDYTPPCWCQHPPPNAGAADPDVVFGRGDVTVAFNADDDYGDRRPRSADDVTIVRNNIVHDPETEHLMTMTTFGGGRPVGGGNDGRGGDTGCVVTDDRPPPVTMRTLRTGEPMMSAID